MNAFLWSIIVIYSVESVGKLFCLASGVTPTRTPFSLALDVATMSAFIVWAVTLLK